MPKQPIKRRFFSHRISLLCLIYGAYAVLCHLVMILLHIPFYDIGISASVLAHHFFPWIEHSLMSLVLILGGATVFDLLSL